MPNNEQHKHLSVYIHFPWCKEKCPYCDFNSHALKHDLPESDYVDRIVEEMSQQHTLLSTRRIHTVFMGGGTPSLFSGQSIARLLTTLRDQYNLTTDAEITLEANPGTTDSARFRDFVAAGVNRLSIGCQSFDNNQLQILGRIHDQTQAIAAFTEARQAGFNNINIDLMFGLPGQRPEQALNDLEQAIALQPEHISWYQLTIEPHTHFYQFPPSLPNDDNIHAMHQAGIALLQQHGYQQYEISAFSQNNRHCQHNLNYWRFGDYLGLGAGAHSKLTQQNRIQRHWNLKHPKAYLSATTDATAGSKTVHDDERVFEFFMNRLRLQQPITESELIKATSKNIASLQPQLAQLQQQGLLNYEPTISLTQHGRLFLNDVLTAWL